MIVDFFRLLFSGTARRREAQVLYIALVQQSRNPFLYTECAVPDTLDGRFDLILLHLYLFLSLPHEAKDRVMRRLLLESLFEDMDRSLREMGVGDMGVGRRVKSMSKAAYGRLLAYTDNADTPESMRATIIRNVYRGNAPAAEAVDKLVAYVNNWQQPDMAQPLSA